VRVRAIGALDMGVTVPEALLVRADKVTRSLWREAALGVTSGVANSDALKLLMSSV
jgi:hypothetical protein